MEHVCASFFFRWPGQTSDSSTLELRRKSHFFFFLFLFILFNVMPLIWATETVLDVYTLNKTSQEFSYINFITRYCLKIMNYILYWSSLVSLPSKNTEEDTFFDEMKHVSIVHVCSCLFCIKKDYIAMCVMFDKYTCFAARLM